MPRNRPRIGIDLDHEHDGRRWIYKLSTRYTRAVVAAGGQPVLLSPDDARDPAEIAGELDGVLMTGGDDIHPRRMGLEAGGKPMRLVSATRERFVLDLARHLLGASVPCLAVCLGCQAINIAAGGDIWLDLYAEYERAEHRRPVEHRSGNEHLVRPEPGGLLARYWSEQPQRLKSHHHQAVRRLGEGLTLEASAEDGVIEAFRRADHPFLVAVQWHPEAQMDRPGGRPLLAGLIEAATESHA